VRIAGIVEHPVQVTYARIVTLTFATAVVIRVWKVIVAGEQNEWIKKQQMLMHLLLFVL
jgi:hypothetical protein